MLPPPDPIRQRCLDLSHSIRDGDALFTAMERPGWLFSPQNRDTATSLEAKVRAWWESLSDILTSDEREHLERIRSKATNPTWDQAWDILMGRRNAPETTAHPQNYAVFYDCVLPLFRELLDYIKALRLRLFPESLVSDDLRHRFAETFRKLSNDTIHTFFVDNGAIIDWWVAPRKPTKTKTINCALGWIDGLTLHTPDTLVKHLVGVYRSYLRHKGIPSHQPPDPFLNELLALVPPDDASWQHRDRTPSAMFDELVQMIRASPLEDGLKAVIEDDLAEAQRAYEAAAFKACVVMLGAALEGIMLATLRQTGALQRMQADPSLPNDIWGRLKGQQNPKNTDLDSFANQIAQLLTFEDYKSILLRYLPHLEGLKVEGIQSFRNAIHPWKTATAPHIFAFDNARAIHHVSALNILVRHVFDWNPSIDVEA